jgi:hypothetical protein
MSEFEKIIRNTVDGQIRDFLIAHPEVLTGVTRHKGVKKTQFDWIRGSLGKRICRDLTCDNTIARLTKALLASKSETPS